MIQRSWFQSPLGAIFDDFLCSSLCKDLSDNLIETCIVKNSIGIYIEITRTFYFEGWNDFLWICLTYEVLPLGKIFRSQWRIQDFARRGANLFLAKFFPKNLWSRRLTLLFPPMHLKFIIILEQFVTSSHNVVFLPKSVVVNNYFRCSESQ